MERDDKYPIEVIATGIEEDGCPRCRILRFNDAAGAQQTIAVPHSVFAGGPRKFMDMLGQRGYPVPPETRKQQELLKGLGEVPTTQMLVVRRMGWTGPDGTNFVLPTRTFGPNPDKVVVDLGELAADHKFATAGTAAEWSEHVGKLALGNSIAMVAIMTAFAGPIVPILAGETGAINSVAPTSSGKTSITRAGGSVWGGSPQGDQGFLESWLTTTNALDLTLARDLPWESSPSLK